MPRHTPAVNERSKTLDPERLARRFRAGFIRSNRSGLSLLDVIVILVAVVLITSLALLKVGGSRAASRRMQCESNLRSVYLAMESYALRFGAFPIGSQNASGPIRSERRGRHHNWAEGLLPFLGEEALAAKIDFQDSVYSSLNTSVGTTPVSSYRCIASATTLSQHATTYAGVTGSLEQPIDEDIDGVFVLNQSIRKDQITDGLGYTFLIGEKSRELNLDDPADSPDQWNSGTRTSLRNLGHPINGETGNETRTTPLIAPSSDPFFVGGFSSNHLGGGYFLFADGSFRFFTEQADLRMLQAHASRAGESQTSKTPPLGW
ncbi:MAG: DUF1559 domain-containing protein [Planctomycetota bacterium]